MADGTAKVCVICKQDCSGRPHVKDKQGRYACRACIEKQQARSASKPTLQPQPGGMDPVMARLVEGSVAVKSTPCPQCSSPIPPGGVVCVQCGFNTETGKSMRTRVTVEEPEKKKGKKG
ncbi:MAG: hypothetical protein KJZ54_05315 [Phycisphaerales bacterium]|nr:hypothetical protein [Phycisphaerales bacterium]